MALSLAKDIRTIPNLITLSRIGLLTIATPLYFYGHYAVGLAFAIVAALTDYLDGAVARRTGQVTRLGEVLDQFCDLCFEMLALTLAIHQGFFPIYVILVYAFREFWSLSMRRSMAGMGKSIPSSFFGKLKTNALMWGFLPTFLSIAQVLPTWEPALGNLGRFMIYTGLGLSWVSGLQYTYAFVTLYEGEAPGRPS
jgi:CDP-diacylglycerol--glycerol-3-phosphate 3-phosphatidyltransferase